MESSEYLADRRTKERRPPITTFLYRISAVFGVIALIGAIGGAFAILGLIFGLGDRASDENVEALIGSVAIVILFGGVGRGLFSWAERRALERGFVDVSDPAVLEALGMDPDDRSDQEWSDESIRATLAELSLENKIALRDDWAEDPEANEGLIDLADEMIRDHMGA